MSRNKDLTFEKFRLVREKCDLSGIKVKASASWEQLQTVMRHVMMLMKACNATWTLDGFDVRDLAASIVYTRFFYDLSEQETSHESMSIFITKVKISMDELGGLASGRFMTHVAEYWGLRLKRDIAVGKKKVNDIITRCVSLCDSFDFSGILKGIEADNPPVKDIEAMLGTPAASSLKSEASGLRAPRAALSGTIVHVTDALVKLLPSQTPLLESVLESATAAQQFISGDNFKQVARCLGNLVSLQCGFRELTPGEHRHAIARRCLFLLEQTDMLTMSADPVLTAFLGKQIST
jgi:hypothetical protein